jgi:leucyl aminopeptidase
LKFTVYSELNQREQADLLVLPFWEGGTEATEIGPFKKKVESIFKSGDFKGKSGEIALLYVDGEKETRVLLLGLGKEEATAESIRRSLAAAVRFARAKKCKAINFALPRLGSIKNGLRAYLEGMILTNYAFTELKGTASQESPVCIVEHIGLIGLEPQDEPLLKKIQTTLFGVFWVRDLVNRNADDKTPAQVAKMAEELMQKSGKLQVKILNKSDIEKEGMGLLLAVNRSSAHEPRLVQLSYQGNPCSTEHIVLVGKGITYDTGGLSLKPTDGMLTMKCDMSGAATVLASVYTAAELGLKVNVTAVAPLTENMLGSRSFKLGDVYRGHNGKTIEITNTDAEGRLVLADAMSYVAKYLKPTYMVDIASLTGGIIVAIGDDMAGLFTPNDILAKRLLDASKETDELIWRMPMNPDYKDSLKSEVGDFVNSTGRSAGPIKAAFFLEEFTDKIPWAHIDFAGPCFLDKPKHYNTTSATGFGVRLFIEFLEQFK